MKKRCRNRFFTIFLAVILLFTSMPVSALSIETEQIEMAPQIVSEVVERREENVKHFLCDDGSYIAATYSSPVHYLEDGEWKEIDNSLELGAATYSADSAAMYTTAASANPVSLPQSFANGQKISITSGGHTVRFGVAAGSGAVTSAAAAVVSPAALASAGGVAVSELQPMGTQQLSANTQAELDNVQIKAHNESAMAVENQSGAIVYEDIFPGADLEYIVTSNMVKENIVVSTPQAAYTYVFNMDLGGLVPVELANGAINLVEATAQNEPVIQIAAPYMYDAAGAESIAVEMQLTPSANGYTLSLTADSAWINSPERVFPVVIDPTFMLGNSAIRDVFVINGIYDNSTQNTDELRVGRNLTNLARIYMKTNTPSNIERTYIINSATLTLWKKNYYQAPSQDNIRLNVYNCNDVSEWNSSNITWNNQPFNNANNGYAAAGAELLDSQLATSSMEDYEFDITEAVRDWVYNQDNNGLMIASSNEASKTHIRFYSTDESQAANRPSITISYTVSGLVNSSQSIWNVNTTQAQTSDVIGINAQDGWTVSSSDTTWLNVTNKTDNGFRISVTENTNANLRDGTVEVEWQGETLAEIRVYQVGTGPELSFTTTNKHWTVKSKAQVITLPVFSNVDWEFSCTSNKPEWFEVDKVGSSLVIQILENEISENTGEDALYNFGKEARDCEVRIYNTTENLEDSITITQLDPISDYFNVIDANGVSSYKSSSEYNHPLATWAMELSYAAYNPVEGAVAWLIPGMFMESDFTYTAAQLLQEAGFSKINSVNAGLMESIAHTVGYREITISSTSQNNTEQIGGLTNVGSALGLYSRANDSLVSNVGGNAFSTGATDSDYNSTSGENTRTAVAEQSSTTVTRPLVVVAIRGTMKMAEWFGDIGTQLEWRQYFKAARDEVLNTLYGTGDVSNCSECGGSGCSTCKGYIENNNIENPIILITGHSLGAAVANLTAAYISPCGDTACECSGNTHAMDKADVFAYAFATTNTLNVNNDTHKVHDAATASNIFNIMNNNDIVTMLPSVKIKGTGNWTRHGKEFFITMEMNWQLFGLCEVNLDTAWIGAGGHAMSTYLQWLQNFPVVVGQEDNPDQITQNILEDYCFEGDKLGWLTKALVINCPVSVSVKDDVGNTVAFATTQAGVTAPTGNDAIGKIIFESGGEGEGVAWATEESGIICWTDPETDSKRFVLPYAYGVVVDEENNSFDDDAEICVDIAAYGTGTMDISVETAGLGEPLNRTVRSQLPVAAGTSYTLSVPANLEEAAPTLNDSNGDPITNISPYLMSVAIDNEEVTYGTKTVFTVVTNIGVEKIQFRNSDTGSTMTLTQDHAKVTGLVEDTENGTLTWTVEHTYSVGSRTLDVGVRVGSTWYYTERLLHQTTLPVQEE